MVTKRELEGQVNEVWQDQASGKRLSEIVGIADRERFMLTLDHYVCPPGVMSGNTLPEILPNVPHETRVVLLLNAFCGAVFSGGMGQFIIEHWEVFGEVLDACRAVGASQAAEYLEGAKGCFPGARLPSVADECAVLEDDVEDALDCLDDRYRDTCYDEVINCLRYYVRKSLRQFEKCRGTLFRRFRIEHK